MSGRLKIVALEARNSLDFLGEAFGLYARGEPFAICREGTTLEEYPALEVVETITTQDRNGWAQLAYDPADLPVDHPAQVVFSSGTEGKPKAIVISAGALADVEIRLMEVMQITSEIREYIGVPVTYSFGLGRARVVARAGGRFYLPKAFDPVEIRDMLAAGQINAISAVPSLWRLLLAQPGFLGDLGARVRWIEIGSQYMSGPEKAALRQMFPKARIVQHYGLTEASRSTFLTIDGASDDALESVGTPVGRTEVTIGAEGEICIRGPHLALGVLSEDGRLVPLSDTDGWLHTRDRGEVRDGRLYYNGRLDDQINLSGMKFASETLERQVAELVTLDQGHFAITSVADPLRGEVLLLAHDAAGAPYVKLLEAALVQVIAPRATMNAAQIRVLALDDLPRTGSGKVQRRELRAMWMDRQGAEPDVQPAPVDITLTPNEERVAKTWRSVLGKVPLTPASSFYDLGGDSLGAMQIGLAMEAHFPRAAVRATLEGRPLGEIAVLAAGEADTSTHQVDALPARTIESWAINMTRGFMVISVLVSHWLPGIWSRLLPGLSIDPVAFISRMGTPGFAIVFGIGVGYVMLSGYPGNSRTVWRRIAVSLTLVVSAMVLLAATNISLIWLEGEELTGTRLGEAFYGVLGFYMLALLTVPLWLRLLKDRVVRVAAIAIPVMWGGWLLAHGLFGVEKLGTPLEWARLMIVAKYSYLHLMPTVLVGIGIGVWMSQTPNPWRFARDAVLAGAFLLSMAVLGIYETYGGGAFFDREAPFWVGVEGLMFYSGFTCLFLGGAIYALHVWGRIGTVPRGALKGLILFGGLALPVYAFHQLVIPLKDILVAVGLPGALALALTMGAFLGALIYGMKRLRRMYFG